MENLYRRLIDRQKAKVDVLKKEIAKIEARITSLTEMAAEDGASVLVTPSKEGIVATEQTDAPDLPKRRPNKTTLQVLNFIGLEGKSLDELEDFCKRNGIDMDRRALRTFANLYRTRFKVLESERQGFFRLTAPGAEYLRTILPLATVAENGKPYAIDTAGGNAQPPALSVEEARRAFAQDPVKGPASDA